MVGVEECLVKPHWGPLGRPSWCYWYLGKQSRAKEEVFFPTPNTHWDPWGSTVPIRASQPGESFSCLDVWISLTVTWLKRAQGSCMIVLCNRLRVKYIRNFLHCCDEIPVRKHLVWIIVWEGLIYRGRGGMAEKYKAICSHLGRTVEMGCCCPDGCLLFPFMGWCNPLSEIGLLHPVIPLWKEPNRPPESVPH